MERHRNDAGQIQLTNTGDPLIDLWEEQIAQGIRPNLNEAFAPGELDKLQKMRNTAARNPSMDEMSIRDVVEAAERDAAKQSKETTTNPTIRSRPNWTQGFGDGT